MPVDHEHLVWKALVALDEVVADCHQAPVTGSFALRFTLAYLHATGGGDRYWYDEFWRVVRNPLANAYHPDMAQYMRSRDACGFLQAIARTHGIELTFDLLQRLRAEHRRIEAPAYKKKGPT